MMASWGIDIYTLLNFGHRCEWFTLVPKKGKWQPQSRSLDELQNRSGHFAQDKKLLPLMGAEFDTGLCQLSGLWFL
jgi:hypothetical protein